MINYIYSLTNICLVFLSFFLCLCSVYSYCKFHFVSQFWEHLKNFLSFIFFSFSLALFFRVFHKTYFLITQSGKFQNDTIIQSLLAISGLSISVLCGIILFVAKDSVKEIKTIKKISDFMTNYDLEIARIRAFEKCSREYELSRIKMSSDPNENIRFQALTKICDFLRSASDSELVHNLRVLNDFEESFNFFNDETWSYLRMLLDRKRQNATMSGLVFKLIKKNSF